MSQWEVLVGGAGWIDMDEALANGINVEGLRKRTNFNYFLQNNERPSFGQWLKTKEGELTTFEENSMNDVRVGSMVLYHGDEELLHNQWAIVYGVFHPSRGGVTYNLAFMEADDGDVWFTDHLIQIRREEFTPAEKPEIPKPPMRDGFYVNIGNGVVYTRVEGTWSGYDNNRASFWSVTGLTDDNMRDAVQFLAPPFDN
jgi:hypothetical protein